MIISIVGNAESILAKDNGALIDSADLVIRCTFGVPVNTSSQGQRTDVVVASSSHKKNYPVFDGEFIYWWTNPSVARDHLLRVLSYQPSNGIIALEMVKNKYPDADVRIFGFDWKASKTFYASHSQPRADTPEGWFDNTEKHDYASEKKYCLQLIEDMGWTLL